MFCIFVREDYRMGGKDGFRASRVPILARPAGDGAIEERSFVAKSAPLDDGQRRGSMAVAPIVTVNRVRQTAIEERSFVAKGAPLDDGQVRGSTAVAPIVTVNRVRQTANALEADPSLRPG
jgi:hypothetical protein